MELLSFKKFLLEDYLSEIKTQLPPIKVADDVDLFYDPDKVMTMMAKTNFPETSIYKQASTEDQRVMYIFLFKYEGMGYVWEINFSRDNRSSFYKHDNKAFTDISIGFGIISVLDLKNKKKISIDDNEALQKFKDRYIAFKLYGTLMELCRLEFKQSIKDRNYPLGAIHFRGSAEKVTGYLTLGKRIVKELGFIDFYEKYGNDFEQRDDLPRGLVGDRSVDAFSYLYISPRLDASIKKFALKKTERIDFTKEKYLSVSSYHNGYAIVLGKNKLKGLIDTKGNEVIPCEYDSIDMIDGKRIAAVKVEKNKKTGIFNLLTKTLVLPVEYDMIRNFDKVFEVVKGELSGLISKKTFKLLTPVIYKEFGGYSGKVLRMRHKYISAMDNHDNWGLLTVGGKEVVPFKYSAIIDINDAAGKVKVLLANGSKRWVEMKR
jgi:hypothetical protein